MPGGPVIVGQVQTEASPPPQPKVLIQRRITTSGGPETTTFMPLANSEPGMGLGAWWKNSEIVSKLQLSDEQVKKISQTFLDHKLKLIDLQADLEKQELRLQPLMDIDQPDESKVGAQIDLITAARGRLEKQNAMMMLDIRRWLSVEQWKKLKSIEATEEGKHNVMYFRSGPGIGIEVPQPRPLPEDMPVLEKH
jgi:Spy/CpxP family protein refolding chaperone